MHEHPTARSTLPKWAEWHASSAYTVGVEEEVMLVDPSDCSLAHRIDDVLPLLSHELAEHVTAETHGSAIELATSPHSTARGVALEAVGLRSTLAHELEALGLRAAVAGTHPFAVWTDTRISSGARYQLIYGSMRELARREPTFALHVHVGVGEPEAAIELYNRLRAHAPLLLALSANSPFWQGRDTGLASARTPLFQAFPRVGIPRAFSSYGDYAETVDQLLRCEAFPEPTFLWWDVRPQPRLGTVEVRIMDAQSTVAETGALAALVQAIAHLELEEGFASEQLLGAVELLDENRFLAVRDGMDAELLDPLRQRRIPARRLLSELIEAARDHAADLGCEDALDWLDGPMHETGAGRQRRLAGRGQLAGHDQRFEPLVEALVDAFAPWV